MIPISLANVRPYWRELLIGALGVVLFFSWQCRREVVRTKESIKIERHQDTLRIPYKEVVTKYVPVATPSVLIKIDSSHFRAIQDTSYTADSSQIRVHNEYAEDKHEFQNQSLTFISPRIKEIVRETETITLPGETIQKIDWLVTEIVGALALVIGVLIHFAF